MVVTKALHVTKAHGFRLHCSFHVHSEQSEFLVNMATTGAGDVSGRCHFCLNDLKTRPEVRKLGCEHLACSRCLMTESTLKCPECRFVTESDFNDLEVVATYEEYQCHIRDCNNEAATYCSSCSKFFCEHHDQYHSAVHDEHVLDVIGIVDYRERAILLRLEAEQKTCSTHGEDVVISCKTCLHLLCNSCLDEPASADSCAHQSISIKKGSELAFEKVAEETRKLQEMDPMLENLLKFSQQQKEAVCSQNITQIERLKTALHRWQEKLNEITVTLEERINHLTNSCELENRRFEQQINEQLKANQNIEDGTCALSEQHPVTILKTYKTQETELKRRHSAALPPLPPPQLLLLDNLAVKIPWKLTRLAPPYYKSLKITKRIETASNCYSVGHLEDGTMLHGGVYGIVGIGEKLIGTHSYGMCTASSTHTENKASIFTLGPDGTDRIVNCIDSDGGVNTVIRYPENKSDKLQHLVSTPNYIIICDTPSGGLKVFSLDNFEHKFDIQLEQLNNPWGIEILSNNTLVVSDWTNNLIINITIEEKPVVIWQLTVDRPSGIHIDKTTNCILVSCNDGDNIYVISVNGELLTTLSIPDGEGYVHDLSVHENQLALANRDKGVKLFTIEYHTEDCV